MIVESRGFSSWAIALGLLVEPFFVRCLTTLDWRRADLAEPALNAVSTLLGTVLIPLGGILWGPFPDPALRVGTFSIVTGAALFFFMAMFISAGVELWVLWCLCKETAGKRAFRRLTIASGFSIAAVCCSLYL
ncbi:MAG: hypothetical protein WHT82_08385 [Limisphaera sp.]